MNKNARRSKREYISLAFDIPTILMDLKKVIWIIFTLSVPIALLSYVMESRKFVPQYETDASLIVTTRGVNNNKLAGIDIGSKIAKRYTNIIASDVLKKKIAEDVGVPMYEFSISAECVESSNLFKIKVIANSPYKAFKVIHSVMKNYTTITDYFPDETYVDVLTEPAIPTNSFTSPPSKTIIVINLVLVFCGLVGLCAGLSCLKDTIRFGTDVEDKLSVSYLGDINLVRKRERILKKSKNSNNQQGESNLINQPDADPSFVESVFRTSRRIRYNMDRINAKTLLITSTGADEGKSTIAVNIALALAKQGKRVVLVDLDLKCPELYRIIQIPDEYKCSLIEYMEKDDVDVESIIGIVPETGIDAVLNREVAEKSTELLSGDRINALFDFLKERYDYVIIDTSPMSVSSDTEAIAGAADAAIMVLKVHESSAKKINDELDIIYRCQTEIIGCIINGTHNSFDSYLGGSGYLKYCFRGIRFKKPGLKGKKDNT